MERAARALKNPIWPDPLPAFALAGMISPVECLLFLFGRSVVFHKWEKRPLPRLKGRRGVEGLLPASHESSEGGDDNQASEAKGSEGHSFVGVKVGVHYQFTSLISGHAIADAVRAAER